MFIVSYKQINVVLIIQIIIILIIIIIMTMSLFNLRPWSLWVYGLVSRA